ncbi:MAG: efflux RND transporter periplasmic adaptor subunit [Bacillota bacterium]
MNILKNKKIILLLLISLLAILTIFWFSREKTTQTAELQYEQARVNRGDIIVGLDSDGTIEFSKVNLRFGVKGTIAETAVKRGDLVNKGDIIARLDDREYQDQYQLALAKLKDAQEQQLINILDDKLKLQNLEYNLEALRSTYEEMELIPEAYSPSERGMKKIELENKELEYQNSLKKHEIMLRNSQDNELNQDVLATDMARENLEETILYSPVAGTILNLANKAGESISDEQDFAVVHENNNVKAITRVIEYDIASIKIGQKVDVTVEAIPDKKYSGVVESINAIPTTDSSGLVSYEVEIDILNPDQEIRDGMTSRMTFILKDVRDCLIVPYKAVKIIDRKQIVTVLEQDGKISNREIKTGFTDGISVEVLEGLEGNEVVVIAKQVIK